MKKLQLNSFIFFGCGYLLYLIVREFISISVAVGVFFFSLEDASPLQHYPQHKICYTIIKLMRALWLVNPWFIVPVNPWKFHVSSELLCKSNRPQVFMVYSLINHLWCWKNTWRIRKSLACGSWFTNSSHVLPTSRVVYQPKNHRNLWSIS